MATARTHKVMLVDTGWAVHDQLASSLAQEGAVLLHATNPARAVVLAREERPELVAVKMALAGRTGDSAFSSLRFERAIDPIAIVLLSVEPLRWGRRANGAAADAPEPWRAARVPAVDGAGHGAS